MKRPQLLTLLADARQLVGPDAPLPVIVGSQSFHAVGNSFLPESVEQSIECDFYLGAGSPHRRILETELGANSDYFARHGFYAHTVGAGTVIPPPGWEGRLQPVRDEQGTTWALALELHDAAACKLMAGREKDFEFLRDTLRGGTIQVGALLERTVTFRAAPLVNALLPRLGRLRETLRRGRMFPEAEAIGHALARLETERPE